MMITVIVNRGQGTADSEIDNCQLQHSGSNEIEKNDNNIQCGVIAYNSIICSDNAMSTEKKKSTGVPRSSVRL